MKLRKDVGEYIGCHKRENDSQGYHESFFILEGSREVHGFLSCDEPTGVGQFEAILIIIPEILSSAHQRRKMGQERVQFRNELFFHWARPHKGLCRDVLPVRGRQKPAENAAQLENSHLWMDTI